MEQFKKDNPNEELTPYYDNANVLHWVTLPEYYAHELGYKAIYHMEEDDGEA